jgi:O-antigen ligase
VLTSFFTPNPFFGSGVGTTQNYFYTHATGLNVIHSEYVRLLAEVGILGVALMGIAVAAYMIRLARTCRASSTREGRAYSLAALGGIVIYVIFMATDNAIDYVTSCGIFVFALIAMSEKARELEQQISLVQGHELQSSASVLSQVEDGRGDPVPFRRFPLVSWR